jgi:hypothetical protein
MASNDICHYKIYLLHRIYFIVGGGVFVFESGSSFHCDGNHFDNSGAFEGNNYHVRISTIILVTTHLEETMCGNNLVGLEKVC